MPPRLSQRASEPSDAFSPVEGVLERAVADGAFPGCVAAIGGDPISGVWCRAFGHLDGSRTSRARSDRLYDLASLTKVVSATAVSMCLVDAGRLRLEEKVSARVPEFTGGDRDRVTVEHLLTHSSGLPAWRPLYERAPTGASDGRRAILEAILAEPLQAPPGAKTTYSDLGAILLGECLERAGGSPLATLAWKLVFEPLGMRDTLYRPPRSELTRIAPTERDETFRKRTVHGEVHDENAWAMGGVSANAGLFSTARDVARLAGEVLRARRGEGVVFERETVRRFTARRGLVRGSSRALGWDTKSARGSSAGERFSAGSFGHTGFTGTSLWIDPEREVYAVLLSNRVHPTRANRKIRGVRPRFHDAVMEVLGS